MGLSRCLQWPVSRTQPKAGQGCKKLGWGGWPGARITQGCLSMLLEKSHTFTANHITLPSFTSLYRFSIDNEIWECAASDLNLGYFNAPVTILGLHIHHKLTYDVTVMVDISVWSSSMITSDVN